MSDFESAQRRRDVVVGLFVIFGLAALGWMIFKFGDLPTTVSRMRSFQIYTQFPTAPGVQKDTPVRFCGYQVGRVTNVMPPRLLEDLKTGQEYHQTVCIMSINKDYVNIPSNVDVKLMTRGLGSSYLELKLDRNHLEAPPLDPNDPSSKYLKGGMWLQGSTGMTSEFFPEESQKMLEDLVQEMRVFIGNANDILGDPNNKANIKASLGHLSQAMAKASTLMDSAEKTLESFRTLADTGTNTLNSVDAKAERLVASIITTSGELGSAAARLRLAMEKVNQGKGTIGRLINDAGLYENLLENTEQLNVLLKNLQDLIDKVSEKGIRSIY